MVGVNIGPRSQCDTRRHRHSPFEDPDRRRDRSWCAAFPDGIPRRVFHNGRDHGYLIAGDHGVRWEAADGQEFLTHAFLEQFLGHPDGYGPPPVSPSS
jgi:hypothetical protein